MTDEVTLLPCPFCGGEPELFECAETGNEGGHVVGCKKCEACTRVHFGEYETPLREAWNRRSHLRTPRLEAGDRNARAHALLLKICDMDDRPEEFGYDFESAMWFWRLPEDEAGSAYGTDGMRPTTATDFYEAVEALAARFKLELPLSRRPSEAVDGDVPADTGNAEADRIIQRLASSDPTFDDCTDAAVFIRRLVCEHKGPDGFATWKDAALAERLARRDSAAPSRRLTGAEREALTLAAGALEQRSAAFLFGKREDEYGLKLAAAVEVVRALATMPAAIAAWNLRATQRESGGESVSVPREVLESLGSYAQHADHCGDQSSHYNAAHYCGCGLTALREHVAALTASQRKECEHPVAWIMGHTIHTDCGWEYDEECVPGRDCPSGDGWTPLYVRNETKCAACSGLGSTAPFDYVNGKKIGRDMCEACNGTGQRKETP